MAVRKEIPYCSGIYFLTFTCVRWIPLFEIPLLARVYFKRCGWRGVCDPCLVTKKMTLYLIKKLCEYKI